MSTAGVLGAWIIDEWIHEAESVLTDRKVGVITYGDPQWDAPETGVGGVARILFPLDPYRPPVPFGHRFGGFCAVDDPVCGGGYVYTREQNLERLMRGDIGTHASYPQGATSQGAQYLLDLVVASGPDQRVVLNLGAESLS